ncbi:hypothetical protein GA0070561_0997 [Micromonospora saelicesensis]|uniref:Uncharacterized protein n=2 Tax=Micromonospora saelicesensis TaxID=285676 RepID=A0A1C4UFS1_9ACTN|nr:hypothetical protein GA0070561_0997 [Micromonospora saelicesensis]
MTDRGREGLAEPPGVTPSAGGVRRAASRRCRPTARPNHGRCRQRSARAAPRSLRSGRRRGHRLHVRRACRGPRCSRAARLAQPTTVDRAIGGAHSGQSRPGRPDRRPWARRPEATGPPVALVASDGVTTPSGGSTPDDYWRRPDTGDDAVADQPPAAPATTPPTGPTDPPQDEQASPASTGGTASENDGPPPAGPAPTGGTASGHPGPPPAGPTGPAPTGGTASGYSGPPPSVPPPAGWRPPVHLQPAPPRQLPPQDMADLDAAEQRSQRVTYGFGAAAGVVLLVLLCLLCSRVIF